MINSRCSGMTLLFYFRPSPGIGEMGERHLQGKKKPHPTPGVVIVSRARCYLAVTGNDAGAGEDHIVNIIRKAVRSKNHIVVPPFPILTQLKSASGGRWGKTPRLQDTVYTIFSSLASGF